MPERMARTDPFQQIRETIGSGPFRFKAGRVQLAAASWSMSATPDYCPTPDGRPSLTAGPKLAHFDRVEWHIITDAATAAAALQSGEIDWFEQPPPEIQQLLGRNRRLAGRADRPAAAAPASCASTTCIRPSTTSGCARRFLPAISQADFMSGGRRPRPGAHTRPAWASSRRARRWPPMPALAPLTGPAQHRPRQARCCGRPATPTSRCG